MIDPFEHEGTRPGATHLLFTQEARPRVRKFVDERNERAPAIPLLQGTFRELLGSRSVYGPHENCNLAIELVSLPETLVGCLRLHEVVPASSRHYSESMQSMLKSKVELANTDPPPSVHWDPALKRNHTKWLQLFARLL